jgi:hypothetical protein
MDFCCSTMRVFNTTLIRTHEMELRGEKWKKDYFSSRILRWLRRGSMLCFYFFVLFILFIFYFYFFYFCSFLCSRYACSHCPKVFRGAYFVRQHYLLKHSEDLERVALSSTEEQFRFNYENDRWLYRMNFLHYIFKRSEN